MSELKSVNSEVISRETSKDIKQPDIIDDTKIQEVLNIFCKDLSKINSLDECGWTPLYRTIVAGDLNASHILILKGANPNIQCSMGETPLYQAVEMCKLDHVKLLINNGANPNIQQDDGLSPLHIAVVRQNLLIVKFLLKNGANPNIKSKIYSQTPVHLSIKNNGDPMIMLLLVQFNGSLLEKDKFDKRPIDYIRSKEMEEAIEKLKFDKNPNKKLILLPLFQTPKKYKNWAISKVYSNTIRSNSSINNDLNFNSNTVLKGTGKLKYNIIGTNRHDRYKQNNSSNNLGVFKNNKIIKKPSKNDINNEKNIEIEIDKENFEPNLRKRKLSFSIKEESSCVESEKGDSFSERMNIKNAINNKNKNKFYDHNSEDINRLSNIIFSSKEIKESKSKNEISKNNNNFSKIPKNIPYTKSLSYKNQINYINNKNNSINNKNIIPEKNNYKFVQIYGNSKTKKGYFSLNPGKQRKIQNQSMDINEYIETKSERSSKTTKFLYTKPILSLNELNAKKLNLSHSNINYHSKNNNIKNNNNINNKNSTIKKKVNNVKRLFTFMDNDNNNNQEDKNNLLSGNKNKENKSRNLNNDAFYEKSNLNTYSNLDYERKTKNISILNTNRNNTSILNDDSLMTNYIWKFKTIEDDNSIHNKKISGNSSMITYSYNLEITNQNALYPIYEWLKEINLECYYNLFIDKKIYNLDKLIYNLKNGICNISKNDMLKIGITTPGHVYRIITKLEIDSEKINNKISDFIIDRKNILSDGEINILKNSIVYCCGCCSLNNQSKYLCNNDYKKYQLEQWLSRIKMEKYKDNFINNGFDIFEYFILQMFSSIPIDENILKEELKINNINDRDIIFLQINKDIKYIIQKTTTTIKKNNIKNKKINDEEKEDESSNCLIF